MPSLEVSWIDLGVVVRRPKIVPVRGSLCSYMYEGTVKPLELHGPGGSKLYAGREVIQVKRSMKSQQKTHQKRWAQDGHRMLSL